MRYIYLILALGLLACTQTTKPAAASEQSSVSSQLSEVQEHLLQIRSSFDQEYAAAANELAREEVKTKYTKQLDQYLRDSLGSVLERVRVSIDKIEPLVPSDQYLLSTEFTDRYTDFKRVTNYEKVKTGKDSLYNFVKGLSEGKDTVVNFIYTGKCEVSNYGRTFRIEAIPAPVDYKPSKKDVQDLIVSQL